VESKAAGLLLRIPTLRLQRHVQAEGHQYIRFAHRGGEIAPFSGSSRQIAFQEDRSSGRPPTYVYVRFYLLKIEIIEVTYEGVLLGAQTIAILSGIMI
jgi:hypothetical protein